MAVELIRVDVIEHKAPGPSSKGKIKKGGGDQKTKTRTPEEQREQDEKKAAREKANADRARSKMVRSGVVFASMAIRKAAQVAGEITNTIVNNSYGRQVFDAQMSGDTRKAQLLQNQKTKINAVTSFVTTNVNSIASTVAGFAVNPYLGAIQLATYVFQFGIDLLQKQMAHTENMRQYAIHAERQLAQTEYARKRLIYNTFNNRGFL